MNAPALLLAADTLLLLAETDPVLLFLGLPYPADGGECWRRAERFAARTFKYGPGRVGRAWEGRAARVWRGDPMSAEGEATLTLYMAKLESKTFGFDYSAEGAIRDGEVIIASPAPDVDTDIPSGVTVGVPEVIVTPFHDSDGKIIKPGKGVKVRLTGSADLAPGTYQVVCRGTTTNGDLLQCGGTLVVSDTIS